MIVFVQDFFVEQYRGGGELTTEAIINSSLFPVNKLVSSNVTKEIMEQNKHCLWIFGNYSNLRKDCLLYAAKNLNYATIEYDYKHCKYRSIEKHIAAESACDCHDSKQGKLISLFINNSKVSFWMSKMQMNKHIELFPFLSKKKNYVLSSIFDQETIEYLKSLDIANKNKKWLILNSPSWIKGVQDAVDYAESNELEYELVWGLEYKQLLKKMSASKGVIFFPKGGDTCPRWIIEAKILGCELHINDHVQHKNEKWFSTRGSVLEYLEKRGDFFWDIVEENFYEALGIPPQVNLNKKTNFKIIVPLYNASKWIGKCIQSIKRQKYENYKCILIDDMSNDDTVAVIQKNIADNDKFEIIINKEKKYALRNIAEAINEKCENEDVVIMLDGDDWFSSTRTLSKLNEAYQQPKTMVTYGSYVFNPAGIRGPEPSQYPKQIIEKNKFREDQWRASHLRSFKYELWQKLDAQDLKDDDGEYYPMTYDQAIMLPLLEMASERSLYIPEILYVYNKENPLSVDKIKAQQQSALAKKIRSKKKYSRV